LLSILEFDYSYSQIKFSLKNDYLVRGRNNLIEWINSNSNQNFLEYSFDNGATWTLIGSYDKNYNWLLPNFKQKTIKLKISNVEYIPPKLIWDIQNAHIDEIKSVEISKDNKYILSASKDGFIRLWSVDNRTCIDSLKLNSSDFVNYSRFLNSPNDFFIFQFDGVKIYNFATKSFTGNYTFSGFYSDRPAFANNNSSKLLAIGSNIGEIAIFDYANQATPKSKFQIDSKSIIYNMKFSPDGTLLSVGDGSGFVYVYNTSGNLLFKDSLPKSPIIWSVDISLDNKKVIAGTSSGIVKTWNLSDSSVIFNNVSHSWQVRSVRFSEQRYFMSASLDSSIKFHLITNNQNFTEKVSHNGQIIDCNFSDDYKYFASCGRDKSVKLWESPKFIENFDTVTLILKYPVGFELPKIITQINNIERIDYSMKIDSQFIKDLELFKIDFTMDYLYPGIMLALAKGQSNLKYGIEFDTLKLSFNNIEVKNQVFFNLISRVLYSNQYLGDLKFENIKVLNTNEIFPEILNGLVKINNLCIGNYLKQLSFSSNNNEMKINYMGNNNLNLNINAIDETFEEYEIYDLSGKLLIHGGLQDYSRSSISIDLNVANYSRGTYLLIMKNKYTFLSKLFVIN
jgi:WD40 repeat protein